MKLFLKARTTPSLPAGRIGGNMSSSVNRAIRCAVLVLSARITIDWTGKSGSRRCPCRTRIRGRPTLSGNCCTTTPAPSDCWRATLFPSNRPVTSARNCSDTNSHRQATQAAPGGRERRSDCGCLRCRWRAWNCDVSFRPTDGCRLTKAVGRAICNSRGGESGIERWPGEKNIG